MPITCSCGTNLEVMKAEMAADDHDELVLTIKVASCNGCDDTAAEEYGKLEDRIIVLGDEAVDLKYQAEELGTQISQLEQDDFDSRMLIQELEEENRSLEDTISDLKDEMLTASEDS